MKFDIQHALTTVDGFHTSALDDCLKDGEIQQILNSLRRRPVTIGKFVEYRFGVGLALRFGDALISSQTLMLVGDVCLRDANVETEVQRRMNLGGHFLTAEFLDGLFEQLEICIESDGGD